MPGTADLSIDPNRSEAGVDIVPLGTCIKPSQHAQASGSLAGQSARGTEAASSALVPAPPLPARCCQTLRPLQQAPNETRLHTGALPLNAPEGSLSPSPD